MGIQTQQEEAVFLSASSTQGQRIQVSSSRYNFCFPMSWSSHTSTFCWLFLPTWPRSPWRSVVWEGWGGYECEDEIHSCILHVLSLTSAVLCSHWSHSPAWYSCQMAHYGECLAPSACWWSGWGGLDMCFLVVTSLWTNKECDLSYGSTGCSIRGFCVQAVIPNEVLSLCLSSRAMCFWVQTGFCGTGA